MTPMIVQCSSCRTEFELDPRKVPPRGVRARCSVCSAVIAVPAPPAESEPAVAHAPEAARANESAPASTAAGAAHEEHVPASQAPHAHAAGARGPEVPAAVADAHVAPAPHEEPPTEHQETRADEEREIETAAAVQASEPVGSVAPADSYHAVQETAGDVRTSGATAHMAEMAPPEAPGSLNQSWGERPLSRATPSQPVPAQQAPARAVPAEPVPTQAAEPAPSHGGAASTPSTARRPINPFLARDPSLRAKRLARALVSDIVAYHPARHAEGLRDGTLKQLFRDEIKKSYEEYVDQVGPEVAESTTHFRDALNDVLAGGKRIF